MATKRMFSNVVIDSDRFLELSPMSQLLYFHCGMKTDDDGFVSGARRAAKLIGATDDDFRSLIDGGFLIEFPESKVFVVTHHRQNNDLKNDRYHQTNYRQEFDQLEMTANKEYRRKQIVSKVDTDCIRNVSNMDTEQNVTQPNVTQKNVTNNNVGKGSVEGETGLLLLTWCKGFLKPDEYRILNDYLLSGGDSEQARLAIHKWKDNGKKEKFNAILKGE